MMKNPLRKLKMQFIVHLLMGDVFLRMIITVILKDSGFMQNQVIKYAKETKFHVLLPVQNAEIRLIRNGEKIAQAEDKAAEFFVEDAGAYRVEVYIYNKAWIYSNHIRIGI